MRDLIKEATIATATSDERAKRLRALRHSPKPTFNGLQICSKLYRKFLAKNCGVIEW